MCNAAQRTLDTTQNNGHIWKCFTASLAVDNGSTVGAFSTDIAGGVGIIRTNFAIRRVPVDHGIHVASCNAPKQIGFAQGFEWFSALPVWLGNDADPETLRLKHAANDSHAEAWVINIGIACDQNDVATVPTQLGHF